MQGQAAESSSHEASRPYLARIAVYQAPGVPPLIYDLQAEDPRQLLGDLHAHVFAICRERGGLIPFTALREVIDNLLHAALQGVVVSISADGSTVTVADRGPGIADKESACMPGYSTASPELRRLIKGVGSGLPVAREAMALVGGTLTIKDNLGTGTVISLHAPSVPAPLRQAPPPFPASAGVASTPAESIPARHSEQGSLPHRRLSPAGGGVSAAPAPDLAWIAASPAASPLPGPPPYPGSETGRAVTGATDAMRPLELTSRQRQVFLLLADRPGIGPTVVAQELNLSLTTAFRALVALEEAGLVASDPAGKRSLTAQGLDFLERLVRAGLVPDSDEPGEGGTDR